MNSLVLCEGKTDAILISYILINQYGYKVYKEGLNTKKQMTPKYDANNDEYAFWYAKNNSYVLVCSVGGCDNFSNFFKKYIVPIQKNDYKEENIFEKILLIHDKDLKDNKEIENTLLKNTTIEFKSNKWANVSMETAFTNQKSNFKTYLLVIPLEQSGALEDVVLSALAEDKMNEVVVKRSIEYVDSIKKIASEFLSKRRYISKAKLGVTFAIMSPEKVFSFIDELLNAVDWTKYDVINETFNVLKELE